MNHAAAITAAETHSFKDPTIDSYDATGYPVITWRAGVRTRLIDADTRPAIQIAAATLDNWTTIADTTPAAAPLLAVHTTGRATPADDSANRYQSPTIADTITKIGTAAAAHVADYLSRGTLIGPGHETNVIAEARAALDTLDALRHLVTLAAEHTDATRDELLDLADNLDRYALDVPGYGEAFTLIDAARLTAQVFADADNARTPQTCSADTAAFAGWPAPPADRNPYNLPDPR